MAVPSAPTGVTVPTFYYGTGQVPVSWTYVGTGAQTGYQFRWREAGSATWRGETVDKTSATPSGVFPPNLVANSTFDVDTAGWESNGVFGSRPSATFARSTVRAHTGAGSLLATWVTGGVTSWVNTLVDTTTGKTYDASAWVYVPTGSPDPYLDVMFIKYGDTTPVKDAWTRLTLRFTSDVNGVFPGIGTVSRAADQQQAWIDDFSVVERLAPGPYELQVRTRNAEGWGAWSTTQTVNVAPTAWQRVNGTWTPRNRMVRVVGAWRTVKAKEIA